MMEGLKGEAFHPHRETGHKIPGEKGTNRSKIYIDEIQHDVGGAAQEEGKPFLFPFSGDSTAIASKKSDGVEQSSTRTRTGQAEEEEEEEEEG